MSDAEAQEREARMLAVLERLGGRPLSFLDDDPAAQTLMLEILIRWSAVLHPDPGEWRKTTGRPLRLGGVY